MITGKTQHAFSLVHLACQYMIRIVYGLPKAGYTRIDFFHSVCKLTDSSIYALQHG